MKPKLKTEEAYIIESIHQYGLSPSSSEIYLHGNLESYDGDVSCVDWRMAATFIKNLRYLEKLSINESENILIHMSTMGGEWSDGMAIYDAIKNCEKYITILAYQAARSMSSIIFQGADKRVLMPNAGMMLHYGNILFEGTEIEHQTNAQISVKFNDVMLNIYAKKIKQHHATEAWRKKSIDKIKKELDSKFRQHSDWWITSEEAVYWGLADGVFGYEGFEDHSILRIHQDPEEETSK